MKRLILLLLLPVFGYAQKYTAEAPLSKVKSKGFYSITLPPNITSALSADLSDLRILDSLEREVPYVATFDRLEASTVTWTPMKIDKQIRKGCCTVVIIANDDNEDIDHFLLTYKNAAVVKFASIRGSDDGEIWYAVVERFMIYGSDLLKKDNEQLLEIPISNYKYYQLTIGDSTSTPINMMSVQRTREDIVHGSYLEIPDVTITSRDSMQNRETWGIIEFDSPQFVDRIEFDVAGPHLYKRTATLLHQGETQLEPVTTFDIISGQGRALIVRENEKTLYIRVNNDNNPPLKFTQVAAYQLKRSLLAYFEKGNYKIAIGDKLGTPVYDINFFNDSVPAHPGKLEIGNLKNNTIEKAPEPRTFFTNANIIWIAIVVVGFILAGMTVRMLKDKNLNKQE